MNKRPAYRNLRGYAFDPSLSLELETVSINEVSYKIPWESNLLPGPEGEYIKVVDRDPCSNAFYKPINLNDQNILANDGLDPSASNPQFHQQMVYAVSMNTIQNFEKAIGRKVQWSPATIDITKYLVTDKIKTKSKFQFRAYKYVDKLLIYPHAFRGSNAYYSPDRKAILFGYFEATPANVTLHMPGSLVFTCLSHDIIAHEVTHAIIDGMFSRFMEQTHPDVAAFHEAISDIVALFQHFTFPEILTKELSKTRGSFDVENLLGKLAVEFGKASGEHSSLRDGIGKMHRGKWKRIEPRVESYLKDFECHDRGAILVASVFDAFISIYNRRANEIIKIGTNGTGVLPTGELNTHLIKALASEASKTALHVLNMCIRALDYCPSVDITFGDYLRALITADSDLVPNDKHNYRLAFVDAFRRRGIYPEGLSNLSIESLTYTPDAESEDFEDFGDSLKEFLREFKNELSYKENRRKIFNAVRSFINGKGKHALYDKKNKVRKGLIEFFFERISENPKSAILFERLTGLVFSKNFTKLNIRPNFGHRGQPYIKVHDLRLNNRVGPDGNIQNQVIIILEQSCGIKVTHDEIKEKYNVKTFQHMPYVEYEEGEFLFRGTCTLVFDLNVEDEDPQNETTARLKYVISKPILDMELLHKKVPIYSPNEKRAIMQYRCLFGDYSELTGVAGLKKKIEPFAYLHQQKNSKNGETY